MTLVKKIENRYNTKASFQNGWSYKQRNGQIRSGGNCYYFENPKIEAIYQRAIAISSACYKAKARKEIEELSQASKSGDFERFYGALAKVTCTVKRNHIKRYASENKVGFEVLNFKNNDNWSFALNNECFNVRYGAVTKA